MCGIAGCIGHENAPNFVLSSLETLESRGYDSMGIAYPEPEKLQVYKTLGGVAELDRSLPAEAEQASTAIGHTRWATHGGVTIPNAHPHTNQQTRGDHQQNASVAIVMNGIVENHKDLKTELEDEGYSFNSETDTEVIPLLIDSYINQGAEPEEAFAKALQRLRGAYAVLGFFRDQPDTLYAAKVGSPLVLGVNGSEHFAASIPNVLVDQTKKALFLEDNEMAILGSDGYRLRHLEEQRSILRQPQDIGELYERATLGEFPHYMLKEIHDAPDAIRSAIRGRVRQEQGLVKLGGLEEHRERIRNTERLIIVACGTSYHAGLVGERLIEEFADIPVEVQLASEFKYRDEPFTHNTSVLAISQSGETADTIAALNKAKEYGMLKLGINNAPASTIDRITDAGVHCNAGEEVSVASTKAFVSQVTILAEMALALGREQTPEKAKLLQELTTLPDKVEEVLANADSIKQAAEKYAQYKNFLYIGRGYEHPSAVEGALKLKEISYIHAEGCSAGEMKHGTIALIDEDFPTFAIATESGTYDKTISNIEEIRARGGPVIALANEGDTTITDLANDVLYVPRTIEQLQPIVNAVALQLFAYYVAVHKGLDVDRPRNLAKSVTVE